MTLIYKTLSKWVDCWILKQLFFFFFLYIYSQQAVVSYTYMENIVFFLFNWLAKKNKVNDFCCAFYSLIWFIFYDSHLSMIKKFIKIYWFHKKFFFFSWIKPENELVLLFYCLCKITTNWIEYIPRTALSSR